MNMLLLMGSPRRLSNTAELCTPSELTYVGMYSVEEENDLASFRTKEAVEGAKAFAGKCVERK